MEIKFDDAQVKRLVAEGIFAQFTGETRDEIIKQSIQHLFEPRERRQYERYDFKPPSPFIESFQEATRLACGTVLRDMAADENSDLRKMISTHVAEILAGLQDRNSSSEYLSDLQREIGHAIGQVIVRGWSQRKYEGDDD